MGKKLSKQTYPIGHTPNDLKCFGPPATKDADFDNAKIADMGCFTQDGKDTNKAYHAAICQSKKTSAWFVYFEWGRTGSANNSFQFVECSDEIDAQQEFASQLMSKNAKRGQWTNIAGIKTLQAKDGKDCYLVRSMATRNMGLPDGKNISLQEVIVKASVKNLSASNYVKKQDQVISLMRDLNVATVNYTRTNIVGGAVPAQSAIEEARLFLTEAEKLVLKIGNNLADQVADKSLRQITYAMYSRVPKIKPINAPEDSWILSANNILEWRADLDVFEGALSVSTTESKETDPFGGIQIDMQWIDPKSDIGKFIYDWWPKATANRHGNLSGSIKIKNVWKLERHDERGTIELVQKKVISEKRKIDHRPLFQPSFRNDLITEGASKETLKYYQDTNTCLLHHGTRSVNVSSILKTGLRFPKELVGVVITGALLGGGNYNADDIKKSVGYTSHDRGYYTSGNGSVSGRGAFMFANDVVLGNPFLAPAPHGYTAAPHGHHSIFGKARHTGNLANNEWVVFNKEQVKLKYLIEFE